MKFVRRYLKQLDGSLASRPGKDLPTLICETDFQMETADDFRSIATVATEATFHYPTWSMVDQVTAEDM